MIDSALKKSSTEKDLTNSRYIMWPVVADTSPEMNMAVREHEKIAREIEKTSESIRKKHRVLKIIESKRNKRGVEQTF